MEAELARVYPCDGEIFMRFFERRENEIFPDDQTTTDGALLTRSTVPLPEINPMLRYSLFQGPPREQYLGDIQDRLRGHGHASRSVSIRLSGNKANYVPVRQRRDQAPFAESNFMKNFLSCISLSPLRTATVSCLDLLAASDEYTQFLQKVIQVITVCYLN
ncbi:hypothetical protein K0M31_018934 [Melipona bicolor]|uniref:Uncharacterized protein n=1 Tax=Melipona bicolor TaxID=60889 RepID=A0AA40KS63_9HYME|nr:hypothetical protein K0M31_018934 [Melipona bicolor]